MIEGEWRGYRASQDHVVHREYLSQGGDNKRLEWCKSNHSITFTDGTALILKVSEVSKKQLPEISGYTSLISDCVRHDVNSVAKLPR